MNGKEVALYEQLTHATVDPSISLQINRLNDLSLPEVFQLKTTIENELNRNFEILQKQGIDLSSPLITDDGFPRQDIDVLEVRLIRKYLNMLRNDLSKVIDRSQYLLNDHFHSTDLAQTPNENEVDIRSVTIPFARIHDVVMGGPMHAAGILEGDRLIAIGNINVANHMNLKALQNHILQNENHPLPIRIMRNENDIQDLVIQPNRNWDGSGLLGCKLKLI